MAGSSGDHLWISSNGLSVRMRDIIFTRRRGDGGVEVSIAGATAYPTVVILLEEDAKDFVEKFNKLV